MEREPRLAELSQLLKRREEIELELLKSLPTLLGFASTEALILALRKQASSGRLSGVARPSRHARAHGRGTRYSEATKGHIRKAFEAGESAGAIRRRYGASLATLAKWKREWGLTNPRRAKKRKAPLLSSTKRSRLNGHAAAGRS